MKTESEKLAELSVFRISDLEGVEVYSTMEAQEVRGELIRAASVIVSVVDPLTAEIAAGTMKTIKRSLKEVEEARKHVKEEPLGLCRKIDTIAKDFSLDLLDEVKRIGLLLGAYQAAERKKAEKARRQAEEAARKAQREAAERIRKAETEEKAQEEIEKAADIQRASRQAIVSTKASEPKGIRLRISKDYRVTDIEALFKARPECVKLVENRALIRELIKTVDSLPGVEIFTTEQSY
tara:strand:+ start:4135 stop:4845 length:711 start_codon:yes stop_codon:yes gene_type:complete